MIASINELPLNKKIFFASDFHLGIPSFEKSLEREKRIVRWLESIKAEVHTLFIVGDIFDFWFEYRFVVPKGYVRLLGKLAELRDAGVPIIFFTGNHDMWMFGYFTTELGIPVIRKPQSFFIGGKKILLGHGDGLGPGDQSYKFLKNIFRNKLCQWAFARLHPNLSFGIANFFSKRSRLSNHKKDQEFLGEREWLLAYCREIEEKDHHDYYIFGHRHLPLDLEISANSRYINLGEWVNYNTYAVLDSTGVKLEKFEN